MGEGLVRIVDRSDRGEGAAAVLGDGRRAEGALVRRACRDQRVAGARQPLEDPRRILVVEDRGDDDVLVRPGSRSSSQSAASGVWAPSRTSPSRSSSRPGEPHVDARRRPAGRGTPPPPRARRRAARRSIGHERGELVVRAGRRSRPGRRRRASRARSPRRVSPSTAVCSSPTFVSRTTRASTTLVASRRPPRPASRTATSTPRSAKSSSAAPVRISNCVAPTSSAAARTRCDRALEAGGVGLEPLGPAGDVRRRVGRGSDALRAQERRDRARRRRLSLRADDVHGVVGALGSSEPVEQRLHPLEPEPLGRPRRQRRDPVSRRCHRARAGSARASRAPRRPLLRGAFATNRSLASIASARAISPRSRSRSASTSPSRCGARSGFTTALKMRSSSPSSDGSTALRRNRSAATLTRSSAPASAASPATGHGATIRRVSRAGR